MNLKNTENVLQVINTHYVTLKSEDVANNNILLKETLDRMIKIMKEKDNLFKELYEAPFYGGSFFDDLKVGKPDEFDLDLLLVLPKACQIHKTKTCGCIKVIPSPEPGFFWFEVPEGYFPAFDLFIRDGYVQTDLVLNWLKSLLTKTLNAMTDVSYALPKFNSQSGPALTLRLYEKFGAMDIDLVPAFKFGSNYWPEDPYKTNTSKKKLDFFIVPKMANGIDEGQRYWRASFQSQEKELINGKERLKPALRLLKKLRSSLGHHQISSYALKTIVLWDVDTWDWNRTLSSVFLDLLEKYRDSLREGQILYYWNENLNLLDEIKPDTLNNHCNEITKKIVKFKNNQYTNPEEIAKIILRENSDEYNDFIRRYYCSSDEELEAETPLRTMATRVTYPLEQPSSSFQAQLQDDSNNSNWWIAGAVATAGVAVMVGLIFGATRPSNSNRN